jgi:hypothetical protein
MSLPQNLQAQLDALALVATTKPVIRVLLPLRTPSVANLREHWAQKAKRAKQHSALGHFAVAGFRGTVSVVLLTRVSPRQLDGDNCANALKAIRDGVAAGLGIDDGDPRVTWIYDQRKGPMGVEIALYAAGNRVNSRETSKAHSRCALPEKTR